MPFAPRVAIICNPGALGRRGLVQTDYNAGMHDETSIHVRQAIDGNDESVAWIVARLTPLLRSQAAYRLGPQLIHRLDPDDLVSEAWLATIPRLRGLEIRGERATPALLGYLATVIRNLTNHALRRYLRRGTVVHLDPLPDESIPADVANVMRTAMAREEVRVVEGHLARLNAAEREILILRAIEGHSNQVIAATLGIEPKTASKRYERALNRLRSQVEDSVFSELVEPDDRDPPAEREPKP